MLKKSPVVATVLLCLLAGACGGKRYPIAAPWQVDAGTAMTCDQLSAELDASRRTERQIEEVASAGRTTDGERPKLYSMARPDADRAVQARISAIGQVMQTRNCPASH
jgi:hypothetical protein